MKALTVFIALLPLSFGIAQAQIKISALPSASAQLGSEVLPEYQPGQCPSTNGTCGVTTTQIQQFLEGLSNTWTGANTWTGSNVFTGPLVLGSPSGGSQGAGSLNAQGVYVEGVTVPSYPRTAAEIAAGVTPTNYLYPAGNVLRYGADPTGSISSLTAFNNAYIVAMTADPHTDIYIPSGNYLIPNPGLLWTNQADIRIYGDGQNQSRLLASGSGSYTVLTISADTGAGTTGTNVSLSNFSIKNNSLAGVNALKIADYLGVSLRDMLLQSSSNTLTMAGDANFIVENVNSLTWNSNAAGNTSLLLTADTDGIPNGPGQFVADEFNGQDAVTAGGAIESAGTFSTVFSACQLIAYGPNLVSVADFSSGDEVTLLNDYSESSANTTANTAYLFRLGTKNPVLNFTMIGGHFYNGNGTYNLEYAIDAVGWDQLTVINSTFANFYTAAMIYQSGVTTSNGLVVENSSQPGGAATFFDSSSTKAPAGSTVLFWSQGGRPYSAPVSLLEYTVSTLPTCDATNKGTMAAVTDATSPTYNGALTGGGTVSVPVYCNGSSWTSH